MASYVTPLVHATGDLFAVTDNNTLANNEVFLYQRPYAMAYNSVVTSLTSATITQVSLGGLVASNYGISISSNNIIVPLTGIYQVDCAVAIATNATASTQLLSFVKQNGTIVLTGSFVPISNTSNTQSAGSGLVSCSAGDSLGLWAFQNTAGAVNTNNVSSTTYLHVIFMGSQ